MYIHKQFCEELGKLRRATVGDIVKSLGVIKLDGNNISNLNDGLDDLEKVFYTVDYLLEKGLVKKESHQTASYVPDFNPSSFTELNADKYKISQMHSMPDFLKSYWGIGLIIRPTFSKFISNGFRTDEEVNSALNRRLPFITAIVAAVLTALLTSYFTSTPIFYCF